MTTLSKELEEEVELRETATIIEEQAVVQEAVDRLTDKKNERIAKFEQLLEKDKELSSWLATDPYEISPKVFPTVKQLDKFSEHVKAKEYQQHERRDKYHEFKREIIDLCALLEKSLGAHHLLVDVVSRYTVNTSDAVKR